MAAKKDKMIPSEKERKRALKYATPAGTGRMWVTRTNTETRKTEFLFIPRIVTSEQKTV